MLRRIIRLPLLVVALAAASLALATPASATSTHGKVDLDGGSTVLTIAKATAGVLADNDVSVKAIDGADASGRSFTFPITGGSVDGDTVAGKIEHSGGLRFAEGGDKLGVEDFVIDTKKGVLTARVSGTKTRVPLLTLNLSHATIEKSDGKVVVKNVHASLTGEAAAALNKTFGTKIFTKGLTIGTAKVTARF